MTPVIPDAGLLQSRQALAGKASDPGFVCGIFECAASGMTGAARLNEMGG
ncbi:MAG: hypothetical protein AAGC95_09025 [Pseudomonadota bacterium]